MQNSYKKHTKITLLKKRFDKNLKHIHNNINRGMSGRAVECTSLENWRGFTPFVSSNLTSSAICILNNTVAI